MNPADLPDEARAEVLDLATWGAAWNALDFGARRFLLLLAKQDRKHDGARWEHLAIEVRRAVRARALAMRDWLAALPA